MTNDHAETSLPASREEYATFFRRWLASFLDSMIFVIPVYALVHPFHLTLKQQYLLSIPNAVLLALYEGVMISSAKRATWGKQALGIWVTDQLGERLSFWRAFSRAIAKPISIYTLGIGYLMQPFTKRRQTLHDLIAKTLVWELQQGPVAAPAGPGPKTIANATYAGFGSRASAALLDALIAGLVGGMAAGVVIGIGMSVLVAQNVGWQAMLDYSTAGQSQILQQQFQLVPPAQTQPLLYGAWSIFPVALWLYHTLFLCSAERATPGKQALRLFVTTTTRERISFLRASGRYFARWLSLSLAFTGFLLQPFTKRKQALHDLLAGTLVLKKPPYRTSSGAPPAAKVTV